MKKMMFVALLTTTLSGAFIPGLTVDPSGVMRIDAITIQLLSFEPGWKSVFQDEKNVKPDDGYPKQDDTSFRIKGSYAFPNAGKAFVLKQKAVLNGPLLECTYIIEHESGIPLQHCMVLFTLPIDKTKGRALRFDERLVVLPVVFAGKYPLAPGATAKKILVPLSDGRILSISSAEPLKTVIQDDREFKGNIYELRIYMSDQGGGKPVTKSTVTFSLTVGK